MTDISNVISALIEKYGGVKERIAEKLRGKKIEGTDDEYEYNFSAQRLSQYEKAERNPKGDFFERWKLVFGDDIKELAKQKVSRETIVVSGKTKEMTGSKSEDNQESVYRDLVESKTDYRLVPKSILEEKYRIVAVDQIARETSMIGTQTRMINELLDAQAKLLQRISDLEAQTLKVQRSK